VASAMRNVGDSHADPKVKAVWYKKADKFLRSNKARRHKIVQEVGNVVVFLIMFPIAMAGYALCAAGNIVRGVGSAIVGLGEFVTGSESDRPRLEG